MEGRTDGRKDGRVTISLRNFVDEGIITHTKIEVYYIVIGVKKDKHDVNMLNDIVLISISGVYAFRSNRFS